MDTTTQDPIDLKWTTTGPRLATAYEVTSKLGRLQVGDIPPHITPFLAAAGAELASIAEIGWRFTTDDPPVALLRLIARAALVAPQAAGPHTQRLAEQLDELCH